MTPQERCLYRAELDRLGDVDAAAGIKALLDADPEP